MAATLQQPQQGNPQLKRLVYSKYREMLGSYNDKANTIIQSLPAYMVTEDKGFNFSSDEDQPGNDTVDFSVPLPPSLPSTGALPSRRLQTQAPPEPPACVQNAMMTKDKKPFTYTPGGIDLSQIKSPRMAKRIARNAQYEGVTNQPKPSPLSQQQQNSGNQNLPAAPMAASALGMPVQVFPTGPPPPPALPTSSSIPPPPPPMKAQLAPQTNGRDARKSPTPQNFEPPPLGCRPEIKIPANPMATLKKVPKPEPKNDFWVEEYRKDRSKSPMIGDTNQESTNEVRQDAPRMPSPPKPYIPAETSDPRMDINRIAFQQQQQPQQQHRPVQHNPPSQQQMYSPHMDVNRMGYQQQQQPQQYPVRSPSPPRQQVQQQQRSVPQQQRPASPVRTPVGQYQQQRQPPIANQQRVDSPFRSQDNPNLQRPLSPIKAAQSQPTYYIRQQQQQQQPRQDVTSPPPQQKPAQVGSIYIPPVAPENLALNNNSDQQFRQTPVANQQTPPWLSQRQNLKENADWVREVNATPSARTQTPPITPHQSGPGLRIQMTSTTSSNAKEHIIPIQIEKTPTPTRTPSTPGFGPQPYYTNNQQYGSVPSPGTVAARNPNQFVDQGYNSYPNHQQQQQQQQRAMSPPVPQHLAQSGGVRIVPISMEKQDGPFSPGPVRGPIAQSPTVIQNDPRTLQQQQSWSNGAPNQSKSFRILQKITDTDASGKDSDSEQSVELQRPQYSRQMGAVNDGSPTDQMRRMQLNDSDQAFVNRGPIQRQTQRYVQQRPVFSQDEQPQQYIHPSEQQVHEPKIYTGSAIPSRSFKILQAMTTPENAAEMEHSGVENEQISPNNYHPYPPPPSLPLDDPNFQDQCISHPPLSYYYPQYDTESYGDYGNGYDCLESSVDTPNIIITSSEENRNDSGHTIEPLDESRDQATPNELPYREHSALDMLSKRLSEIISPDFEQNISKDDKKYVGDNSKEIQNRDLDIMKSPSPYNEKSSEIENVSEDDSDDLLSASSSSAEFEGRKDGKIEEVNDGLKAIKSVTDIKVYDTDDEEEALHRRKVFRIGGNRDDEESLTESEEEHEGIVNSDSDLDEADDLTEDIDDVEIQEQLSVIFEEDISEADRINRMRPESRNSTASTLSECSTTIANDDDNDSDKTDQGDQEDNSNLVTVRLPLRLSFSRSSNDENVTTVVVGDSEIEDDKSICATISSQDHFAKDEEEYDGNDVSVTFSLTSRSNSIDRSGLLSKTPSADHATSPKDWDDSDSEVSISVSLPMKRNKFMTQTLSEDLTNNVYDFKSPWDSSDSEDEDAEDETRRDEDTLIECIPETILEEVEEDEVELDDEVLEVESEEDAVEEEKIEERNAEFSFKPRAWDIGLNEKSKEDEDDDEEEEDSTTESTSSESEELVLIKSTVHDQILSKLQLEVPPRTALLEESMSFTLNETKRLCDETLNNISIRQRDDVKMSVRDRIAAFESSPDSFQQSKRPKQVIEIASNNTLAKKDILSRNSSLQRSESEQEEEDSGVTSDMSKPVSETDTDPEYFPELRKMTQYQRAATHSRLFKLLQDESNLEDDDFEIEQRREPLLRSRKKIIHNVSITRKSNPDGLRNAETVSQRRERLSLPLKLSTSIDADNLSSSNSPSSPTHSTVITDKLVNELVQSLLLKKDSSHLRNLPLEKLQAAAKKVLQEDLDSLENTSIESTPALTPQDPKNEYQKSYADYYESWNTSSPVAQDLDSIDIVPSKAFKTLQDHTLAGQKKIWGARCPRVLSSKTINRDLSRVAESRESESPETYRSPRSSATPESSRDFLRGTSLSRLGKV